MGKTVFINGSETGSRNGSLFVKKWSYRGLEVVFDQKVHGIVDPFSALFRVFVKNVKTRVFGHFPSFDKTVISVLEREPFSENGQFCQRINTVFE